MNDIIPRKSKRCEELNQDGCVEAGRLAGQAILGDTVTGQRILPSGRAMANLLKDIKRGDFG